MPVYDPNPNLDNPSGRSWGFHLIAELRQLRCAHTPKSYASLRINNVPHLVLEVSSDSAHMDGIDEALNAKWYYMYQPDMTNPTVKLVLQEVVHYLRLGRLTM